MSDQALTELFDNPDEQRAYEEFCANQERGNQPFNLDAPALVCRWRMSKKRVRCSTGTSAPYPNALSWASRLPITCSRGPSSMWNGH